MGFVDQGAERPTVFTSTEEEIDIQINGEDGEGVLNIVTEE